MTNQHVKKIKRQIVLTAYSMGEGHIPSALSILDILWVLYDRVMKFDPCRPNDLMMDRFILSKGHASLALYSVLAEKGFFPSENLTDFCTYGSKFGGHPDCNKIPGVEASTGSLGHGFPMAVGLALGSKIRRINNRIFCLIGDGESNEGTIWESALLASHHELSNLCCIVDYNHSTDRALKVGNLAEKFASFGWQAVTIQGHDHKEIHDAFRNQSKDKPTMIVAETIKGCGIARMENSPAWHHRSPTSEELKEILEELT
ncbi:MAG: transketolase [Candidatus Ozemobacteraceae bacterium]